MKLTFKVTSKESRSIVSLIKKIDKISCQISFDLENGIIAVQNTNGIADEVIDLIDELYNISSIEIDNLDEQNNEVKEVTASTLITTDVDKKFEAEAIAKPEEVAETIQEEVANEEKQVLKPFDSLEIDDNQLRDEINKFVNSSYLAMNKGATIKDVTGFIRTAKTEMLFKFQKKDAVDFSVGDVVDCCYGFHLPGEINGAHVHAIVCDVIDDMVYVVPITKATGNNITSLSYIEFKAPDDVTYNSDYYTGGTALLDKGRYIHINRVGEVVGRAEKFFFKEVTHLLTRALNFTDNISAYNDETSEERSDETEKFESAELQNVDSGETENEAEPEDEAEDTETKDEAEDAESEGEAEDTESEGEVEDANPEDETEEVKSEAVKAPKKRKINKSPKPGSGEAGVYEFFGDAILNLDSKKATHKQAIPFMKALGMDPKDKILVEAFTTAPYVDAITYENIADRICETVGHTKSIVVFHMKMTFQKWLKSYPELKEKYPRISFVSFLKVFAREVS